MKHETLKIKCGEGVELQISADPNAHYPIQIGIGDDELTRFAHLSPEQSRRVVEFISKRVKDERNNGNLK